ncbi:MAG: MBL fold metallo-hydrolase [Fibrobacter sp.]|nr:MBL fold metallo-hydrolase [Fibrobacter sp.]
MGILKLKRGFCFKITCIFFIIVFCICNNPSGVNQGSFTFSVLDIGQGLSQIAQDGANAIVWDMGPPGEYEKWKHSYIGSGKPRIDAIVISHRDIDHSGGLMHIDTSVNWSGTLVMSSYEDSSYLRNMCRNWSKGITCKVIREGEKLDYLDEVDIECIWPFESQSPKPCSDQQTNYYSMVFLLRHNLTQVIITSDIDSSAGQLISMKYGKTLMSDIMVIPHHGSRYSVNRTFFGYIKPDIAIISCSQNNTYGHPSDEILKLLMLLGSETLITYVDSTIVFRSNGFYWERF